MFNRRNSRSSLLILLVAALGAQSCINQDDFNLDNLEGVKASPSLAIPLLQGSLTINDLLPANQSDYIQEDKDGLIHLTFSDTLRSTSIQDHFLLPTKSFNKSFPVALGALTPGGQRVLVEDRQILNFDFQDADFEKIKLKAGKVEVKAGSTLSSDVQLQLNFPTLQKNGTPLSVTATLPQGSNYNEVEINVDIKGYEVDFSKFGKGENHLPVDIRAEVSNQESQFVYPTDEINLEVEIGDLEFSLITGNLGQPQITLTTSEIPISIFEGIFNKGNVGLKDPALSFEVLNSNGAPLRVETNILQARSSTGEVVDIKLNPSSPIDISFPTKFGETSHSTLEVTNVGEIIDLAPSFIDYNLTGQLNKTSTTSTNFLTDSSQVAVILNADVPLWGYVEGFSLTDTLDMAFDFKEANVQEGSLRLMIENEFPLEAQLQIEFIDDNYDIQETLFTGDYQTLLPASTVNADGELVSAGKYTGGDIIITSERFERILKATRMIVKANLYTSRNADGSHPHVKIKSSYKLNVNLGVKTTANLTVEL